SPSLHGIAARFSPDLTLDFGPFRDVLWVPLSLAPAVVLTLQAIDGYRPLVDQSRTRVLLGALVAPLVGLGAIAVVLFALHEVTVSRLFIFLFTFLSMVGLCTCRMGLRAYRIRRLASGFYARHLVLAGPSDALGWMAAHLQRLSVPEQCQVVGYLS